MTEEQERQLVNLHAKNPEWNAWRLAQNVKIPQREIEEWLKEVG